MLKRKGTYESRGKKIGPGPSRCAIGTRSRLEADLAEGRQNRGGPGFNEDRQGRGGLGLDEDRQGRGGQSTVEYIILVAAVIAALIVFLPGTFKNAFTNTLSNGTDGMENMARRLAGSRPQDNGA